MAIILLVAGCNQGEDLYSGMHVPPAPNTEPGQFVSRYPPARVAPNTGADRPPYERRSPRSGQAPRSGSGESQAARAHRLSGEFCERHGMVFNYATGSCNLTAEGMRSVNAEANRVERERQAASDARLSPEARARAQFCRANPDQCRPAPLSASMARDEEWRRFREQQEETQQMLDRTRRR